jgi:transposase
MGQLMLTVASTHIESACPPCEALTRRVHSRYQRTLHDLPCVNFSMTLQLQVRKFFCINPECKRRIFTERLPEVAVPWARRTRRLTQHLMSIGVALGRLAGERLSHHLGWRER